MEATLTTIACRICSARCSWTSTTRTFSLCRDASPKCWTWNHQRSFFILLFSVSSSVFITSHSHVISSQQALSLFSDLWFIFSFILSCLDYCYFLLTSANTFRELWIMLQDFSLVHGNWSDDMAICTTTRILLPNTLPPPLTHTHMHTHAHTCTPHARTHTHTHKHSVSSAFFSFNQTNKITTGTHWLI